MQPELGADGRDDPCCQRTQRRARDDDRDRQLCRVQPLGARPVEGATREEPWCEDQENVAVGGYLGASICPASEDEQCSDVRAPFDEPDPREIGVKWRWRRATRTPPSSPISRGVNDPGRVAKKIWKVSRVGILT